MFATLSSKSKTNFAFQNRAAGVSSAPKTAQRDWEVEAEADTWDSYLGNLRREMDEVIANRANVEQDYQQLLVEADAWERRLAMAVENNCDHIVRKALLHKNDCTDRASQLKAAIEQYTVQISMLQSQMGFWANQVS